MSVTIAETDDLGACHALRRAVFIVEQSISEPDEWDDLDPDCTHLLASDAGRPVGTARIYREGDVGHIGRVCILKSHRGTGLGATLIRTALDHVRAMPGVTTARLGAQTHAIPFYAKLGFTAHGPEYDDAGIPHRDMDRAL